MKINKNLIDQYKAILIEASLPPIPPEEPTVQDTTNDEYMMSMGPPLGGPGRIPSDFFGGPLSDHLPSWLRGVKDLAEAYQRYMERIPKYLRGYISPRLFERFLFMGILPTDLLFVPVLVFDNVLGRTVVRYIPFFRGKDGGIRFLDYTGQPININDPLDLWDELQEVFESSGDYPGGRFTLHPGYRHPNAWENIRPGNPAYERWGPFVAPQEGGYWPLHAPIGIGPNGETIPGNGWRGWPSFLVPALVAPWLATPWFQDEGGSIGQPPESPATAPHWQA